MTDAEIDIVAAAIKKCTDDFESPVCFYVEPEARHRWEKEHPDGDWYETPEFRDELVSYKIIARAAIAALRGEP